MLDAGVPGAPCIGNPSNTYVFDFPIGINRKVPRVTAMEQHEKWALVKQQWTDHNPSVTINYRPYEYMGLGAKLYSEYWEYAQGLSFLPKSDHVYAQAPYESITKEQYDWLVETMPKVPWENLSEYELEDNTKSGQAFSCTGGSCEIVDTTEN